MQGTPIRFIRKFFLRIFYNTNPATLKIVKKIVIHFYWLIYYNGTFPGFGVGFLSTLK